MLREIGTEQEQAAATLGASPWQTFRRVTLPAIRWAIAYGVVLTTARALGEFGAVSVVSGHIVGKTETLTLHVESAVPAVRLRRRVRGLGRPRDDRDRDAGRDDAVQAEGGGALMAIVASVGHEAVRRVRRARRRLDRGPGRLADGAARAERQRQVDAAARHRRARAARVGHGRARRRRRHAPGARRSAASASSSSTTPPSST